MTTTRRAPLAPAALAGVLTGALAVGGCAAAPSGDAGPSPGPTSVHSSAQSATPPSTSSGGEPSAPGPAPTLRPKHRRHHGPATGAPDPTRVEKVLVFVEENHSLEQMRAEMPFTVGLAGLYGYADDYFALTHPSLPNYLAIAGGTTSGVTDDQPPSVHGRHGASVFGQALASGRTATVYLDGMPGPCALDNGGDGYAVKHNPWAYHVDERAQCVAHDVPLDRLAADTAAGTLPTVGMVVPNLCHDAHDCSLGVADDWLRDRIGAVMAGPDWRSGRLAIIVTADEDETDRADGDPVNRVLTVVAHPALHGVVVHDRLDHLSLSRALSEMSGSPPLADAATAVSLWTAFGITPAG